jgi:hypothetical protein
MNSQLIRATGRTARRETVARRPEIAYLMD